MKWSERKEYPQAVNWLFPRKCAFCGRTLGLIARCEACEPERKALLMQPHRLRQELHYLNGLTGAAALYRYEGAARAAIRGAKYGGKSWNGTELGIQMAVGLFGCTFDRKNGILILSGAGFLQAEYDCIVTVPPSDDRRGFNLPELLARPIAQAADLPLYPAALRRKQGSTRQAGLGRAERLANAAGAFSLTPAGADLEGKRILLVDDVITTGATVSSCAGELRRAGAQNVFAVSAACSEPDRKE